jgi:hypothetical protein
LDEGVAVTSGAVSTFPEEGSPSFVGPGFACCDGTCDDDDDDDVFNISVGVLV